MNMQLTMCILSRITRHSPGRNVIHGTVCTPRVFYYHYGTGKVYSVSSEDNLTEQDITQYWPLVEAADKVEIQSFVDFKVFKAVPYNPSSHRNVVDAIWVRR